MSRVLGLLGAAGAVVILFAACGGKVVVDAPSGAGAGGDGGASTFTTADGAPNPTSSSGLCDPTYTCFAAISLDSLDPGKLCPGSDSAAIHDALLQCACVDSCANECGSTACAGVDGSSSCKACVSDPMTGCALQLNACLQDK